ncbi:MAG: MFS transporter [Methanomicrobiales archaeon]|nr:MFS transporter [Methanomicrobiales archaeon]
MTENTNDSIPILWLSAAHVITDLYLPVVTAIIPLLISTYGFSYFLAGMLVTIYNVTSSMMQPVFGWISDQYGIVIHIAACLLISSVFISAMGLSGDIYLLLLFAALAALGHAAFHPNAFSIVNRLCTPENRGKITSFFVVGGNLGYAVGPLLAAAIIFYFGLSGLPLLVIPALLMAVMLWKSFPVKNVMTRVTIKKSGEPLPLATYRPIIPLFSASTLRAWTIFCALAFFPSFLMSRGLDLISADILISAMLLAGVAGQLAGGYLSDIFGRKEYIIAGSVLAIPSFYGFILTSGIISVFSLLVFGFALWSGFAVTVAIAHEMLPGKVAFTSGLMLGASLGVGGIGVAIFGFLADRYSLAAALQLLPFLIIFAGVLIYLLKYPWKSWHIS